MLFSSATLSAHLLPYLKQANSRYALSELLQGEPLQTESTVGQRLCASAAVCSSIWYRLKIIPVSKCVFVQMLCSLSGEGICSLLCLGFWKFLRKFEMCRNCTTFSSLTLMSFVLFLKLSSNVCFFPPHCYAAIASPTMRGQNGKYQPFIIWFSC